MTLRERLRSWLGTFLLILAILAVAVVAEYITPLRDIDTYLGAHPATARGLRILTIGLIVLGGVLMVGTQFVVRVGDERPLSQDEVREEMEPAEEDRSIYRFWGISVGSGFSDEASFHEVKGAWRQGAWLTSPRWRRFLLMILGAFMVLYGLFGLFIVIGPPWIKLLSILAILYATLRTAWAFWHA